MDIPISTSNSKLVKPKSYLSTTNQSLINQIKHIMKTGQYGLTINKNYKRIVDETWIYYSDFTELYTVHGLCIVKFLIGTYDIMDWIPIHQCGSKEEAIIWCDIRNLTIGKEDVLKDKYKHKIDDFNKDKRDAIHSYLTDSNFQLANLYPPVIHPLNSKPNLIPLPESLTPKKKV